MKSVLSLVAALAVMAFVGSAALADKAPPDKASNSTVTGTISKASSDSITVTDKDGKDHTLSFAKDAKITCDGQACKASDLKAGVMVTVTLNANDNTQATQVDAKTK